MESGQDRDVDQVEHAAVGLGDHAGGGDAIDLGDADVSTRKGRLSCAELEFEEALTLVVRPAPRVELSHAGRRVERG